MTEHQITIRQFDNPKTESSGELSSTCKKRDSKTMDSFQRPAGRLAGIHTIRGPNRYHKLPIDDWSHTRSDSGNRVTNAQDSSVARPVSKIHKIRVGRSCGLIREIVLQTHRIRRSLGRFPRFSQFVPANRAVSQDSHNSWYIYLLHKSSITQQRNLRRIDLENSDIICVQ